MKQVKTMEIARAIFERFAEEIRTVVEGDITTRLKKERPPVDFNRYLELIENYYINAAQTVRGLMEINGK